MTLIVYRQAEPLRTNEPLYRRDIFGKNEDAGWWHRANLVKVGEVETFEQAKTLCTAPVVEAK